ncbi:MAG: hypothetical protein ABIE74_02540 [Pseudomonadota bacterium]
MKLNLKFFILSAAAVLLITIISYSCGSSSGEGGGTGIVTVNRTLEGATNIAVNSTFSKTFTMPVNTTTVASTSFFIVPTSSSTSSISRATFNSSSCNVENKLDALVSCVSTAQCSLDPINDLTTSTSYTICLTSDVLYTNGTHFTAEMFTFTTASESVTPGGTVTISGTLTTTSASSSLSSVKDTMKAATTENYRALILNMTTGEQKVAAVDSNGEFSTTVTGGSDYSVNFLDSDFSFVGTLATNTPSDNKISVALTTGTDGSTTNLGIVTANTSTGQVTSDQVINVSTGNLAYADDTGLIAGGKTGDGTTDYTTSVGATACTASSADCQDFDHDGVPDILDSDNNNDSYSDEVDGVLDYCVPGDVKLYVDNYPASIAAVPGLTQPGFPTQDEVDQYLGNGTKYQINIEYTPGNGYTIDNISEISVSTPGYITQYGYVANVTSGHSCFNTLWTECNSQKLLLSNDGTKYDIGITRSGAETGEAPILENMFPGDTFILNFTMTDGTTHTCTRKVNIIPKYYAYALQQNSQTISTGDTIQLNLTFPVTFSWTVPSRNPTGMTYQMIVSAYPASGCAVSDDMSSATFSAGMGGSTVTVNSQSEFPTSPINAWGIQFYAITDNGDQSFTTMIQYTTQGTNPCP